MIIGEPKITIINGKELEDGVPNRLLIKLSDIPKIILPTCVK